MSLVSVIVSTHNNYVSLQDAIRSVLDQTDRNIELIIVDYKSTDEQYKNNILDERYKVVHITDIKHPYQSIYAQARIREEGLRVAKGDWIAFLDSNDKWLSNKIETQRRELSNHPDIYFTCSNIQVGSEPYYSCRLPSIFYPNCLVHANYVYYSSVLLHRSIAEKLKEDNSWFDVLSHSPCLYHPEPLVHIRNK